MSREHQLRIVGTSAAVLVTVLSVVGFRRGEDDATTRAYELYALPFAVILLLLLAYVVFRCLVPLAELVERPVRLGLGMSVLGLLLILVPFWIGVLSLDWGFFGGMSVVMGAGGALVGMTERQRPAGPIVPLLATVGGPESERPATLSLPLLITAIGLLAIIANFATFALDVFIV